MKNFWRDNWPWIAAPFVLIIIAVALILLFADGNDPSDGIYNIF